MLRGLVRAGLAGILVLVAGATSTFAQDDGWSGAGTPLSRHGSPGGGCGAQAKYGNVTLENVFLYPTSAPPNVCTAPPYGCTFRFSSGAQGNGGTTFGCGLGKEDCHGQCVPTGQCPGSACSPCKTCSSRLGPTYGNPVMPGNGEKREYATDFATGGSIQLRVDRTYRSMGENGARFGLLGNRWRLPWDSSLQVYPTQQVLIFTMADDTYFSLQADINGVYRPTNAADWNITGTHITTAPEAYEITGEDDSVYRFETLSGDWRLRSIKQRSGYTQTVNYDAAGLVTTVSDSLGRTLTFTYEPAAPPPYQAAPRAISRIVGPGGLQIDYTYERYTDPVSGYTMWPNAMLKTAKVSLPPATDSETTTYHYEDTNNFDLLTGVTDPRNIRYATFAYDSTRRALSTEHAGGTEKYTFSYDDAAGKRTVTNPLGKQTVLNFTLTNNIWGVTSIDGLVSSNCPGSSKSTVYDTNGRITEETDEEGRVTHYDLDSRGLPTSITRGYGTPQAVTTTFTNHATLRVPTQMVEPGLTTNYTWTSGRLTSLSKVDTTTGTVPYSSNGQTRTWTYNYATTPATAAASGLLASVDGPLSGTGDTVSYAYDANGYVNTVTNEVGHVTTVNTKNARGQPTQITDPNGVVSNLTYDLQGRLLTVTVNPGASQAVTTMTYDTVGNITKITKPDGSWFSYTYDDARFLTTVTSINGETINYSRDLMGNITATNIKDTAAVIRFSQTQTFDELGRLLKSIGANTQTTTYGYEKNDNLKTVTDPRSGVYSYAYDSLNRLIRETDQETSQVNYTLDGRDNVVTYADPRNLQTTYIRNGFGETKRQSSPDSGNTDYVRDLRGLVTQKTDARAIVTNMTYDNAGRIKTKSFPAATAENVTFTYDAVTPTTNKGKGKLTSMVHEGGTITRQYDVRGNMTSDARVITASGTTARTVSYLYDTADNITRITYPSGRQVQYTRGDTTGRITQLKTKKTASDALVNIATSITYQPVTRLIKNFTYGNALTHSNTYTLDYELSQAQVKNGATVVLGRSYARTDNLNLTGITDQVTPANNQTLGYSAANRLNSASGPYGSQSWAYDGVGNRTSQTIAGATTTFNYPATSNKLQSLSGATTRAITYDNAGNILTDSRSGGPYTFAYNNANRLKTVTVGGTVRGTYVYNGFEQLISRVITNSGTANGTTYFVHDSRGNVIAELNATGATVREYVYLIEAEIAPTMGSRTQVDIPVAVVDGVNTATPVLYMVHTDQLGRPVRMTDSAKASVWDAVYTPWGAPHAITGAQTLNARFPGQWFQLESGLHYNWHRHYDPSLGRYTQPDPLGFVDGPSVYAYARGRALSAIDRDGRQATTIPGPLFWVPPVIAMCWELYREWAGGGGGGGGDDDDDPCEKQVQRDENVCRLLPNLTKAQLAVRSRCWDSSAARYGACKAGKPLPPLITW